MRWDPCKGGNGDAEEHVRVTVGQGARLWSGKLGLSSLDDLRAFAKWVDRARPSPPQNRFVGQSE